MTIADIRTDYRRASLSEDDVAADPIAQFTRWFDEAVKHAADEAKLDALAVEVKGFLRDYPAPGILV